MHRVFSRTAAAAVVAGLAAVSSAQLRVAAWNISFYGGGRIDDLKTAIYAQYNGRSMSPDAFMTCEFTSETACVDFLTVLNTAPGSPGDWARFTFVDGPDTDATFFYRTSKLTPVNPATQGDPDGLPNPVTVVSGGNSNGAPRNVYRFDMRLVGYASSQAVLSFYPVHMKSGSASSDQSRRLVEANAIVANVATLPSGWIPVIGGDFNVQSSSQSAYQALVNGPFRDPIMAPGSWNNNGTYAMIHTQDPIGAGGMDDRHDQILLGAALLNGTHADYIGSLTTPWNLGTWDDPNHSYRAWGNDGTSFNLSLTVSGNQMVGPTIAQALINAAAGAGHLPVFLDIRVPAAVATSTTSIDIGDVYVGDPVSTQFTVFNSANAAVWTAAGVQTLTYSMSATAGLSVPTESFNDQAGGGVNTHALVVNTGEPGDVSGQITVSSNALDNPVRTISVVGRVLCHADIDKSGFVDLDDFIQYVGLFEAGDDAADFDGTGFVDFDDYISYVDAFEAGC